MGKEDTVVFHIMPWRFMTCLEDDKKQKKLQLILNLALNYIEPYKARKIE